MCIKDRGTKQLMEQQTANRPHVTSELGISSTISQGCVTIKPEQTKSFNGSSPVAEDLARRSDRPLN